MSSAVGLERVAHSPNGVYQPAFTGALEGAAQRGDVGIYQVRLGIEREVPDLTQQFRPAHRPAGIEQEVLQQTELTRGQRNDAIAAADGALEPVQLERAHLEHPLDAAPLAPGEGAYPRQQLDQRERLDQIVVRTGIEPRRDVLRRVAAGQDQDRRDDPLLAQRRTDGKSIGLRNLNVQHEEVERLLTGLGERRRPVERDLHGVAILLQALLEEADGPLIVFDYQNLQGSLPAGW